jgi:hypothetical protein
MKSTSRWVLISLLAGLALYASAQESEEAQEPQKAQETEDQAPAPPAEPSRRPAGASQDPEIFVPTEEISEDFAVSFPVDI